MLTKGGPRLKYGSLLASFRSQSRTSPSVVYGTESNVFVLSESNDEARMATKQPAWKDEINYETLDVGAFNVANKNIQIKECAFFDVKTGMLIVTGLSRRFP